MARSGARPGVRRQSPRAGPSPAVAAPSTARPPSTVHDPAAAEREADAIAERALRTGRRGGALRLRRRLRSVRRAEAVAGRLEFLVGLATGNLDFRFDPDRTEIDGRGEARAARDPAKGPEDDSPAYRVVELRSWPELR